MTLLSDFEALLREVRSTAPNFNLALLSGEIREIEEVSAFDKTTEDCADVLTELMRDPHLMTSGHQTNKFAQAFGEAYFASLCARRGNSVQRVPEKQDMKTPDFTLEGASNSRS